NWRARLRAQRAWWRRRLRALAGDREVLFPEAGGGVVAVETLAAGAGSRIAILHATAGSGHKSAAVAISHALAGLARDAQVREVDTLVFASRFYPSTYAHSYSAMAQGARRRRVARPRRVPRAMRFGPRPVARSRAGRGRRGGTHGRAGRAPGAPAGGAVRRGAVRNEHASPCADRGAHARSRRPPAGHG